MMRSPRTVILLVIVATIMVFVLGYQAARFETAQCVNARNARYATAIASPGFNSMPAPTACPGEF